ncbi:NADPH-cytochrome P450 reductase [Exophiala xenobiotica]|nr:NADPH-cytochrome P450 reductase [Exophiala xenobiotica]KAK5250776.1 NADPH-cytochrome P450 reductase [Exophiala xenobiotica]KAK5283035.1 hypothetical protein LTR40_002384 [Exophiala xenobiotica]KAK5351131.1 NADPH-cytochrome P450 reductase [Exophiala xenobiotica]KAK5366477.1 NADPH-cytochrome P450 reductase [Exophiala xenobiotica]
MVFSDLKPKLMVDINQPWTTIVSKSPRVVLTWDDLAVLVVILVGSFFYLIRRFQTEKIEDGFDLYFVSPQEQAGIRRTSSKDDNISKSIAEELQKLGDSVCIFWGSQSGRGKKFAQDLARECRLRCGIPAMAADLAEYDHEHLSQVSPKTVIGFVVATFGEGDPCDNAVGLHETLQCFQKSANPQALSNLSYFAFGLGNSRYQYFNAFVDFVDSTLAKSGAHRLGDVGKADEAFRGDTTWTTWKRTILSDLAQHFGREQTPDWRSNFSEEFHISEPEHGHLLVAQESHVAELGAGKSSSQSVVCSKVSGVRLIPSQVGAVAASSDDSVDGDGQVRRYLHVEFDGRSLQLRQYQSGDHLAVWPINVEEEVKLLAENFGFNEKALDRLIEIEVPELQADNPIPTPTTRRSLLRYYLDISGPVSLELVQVLARYAPTEAGREYLDQIVRQFPSWVTGTSTSFFTIGKLMRQAVPDSSEHWPSGLFAALLGNLPKLRPRYFSIASSPLVDPDRIAITVSVLEKETGDEAIKFHGLTTNYLLSLYQQQIVKGTTSETVRPGPTYDLNGPRGILTGGRVLVQLRQSPFRLPIDERRPILMIGAGSGVAPFRAFVQERVQRQKQGIPQGRMILVFGCRSPQEDFLYAEEWERYVDSGIFQIHCAFSRHGPQKVYVQDKLWSERDMVRKLIMDEKASIYLCGSLNMAEGVKKTINEIVSGSSLSNGHLVKMKKERRLQEDVWAS